MSIRLFNFKGQKDILPPFLGKMRKIARGEEVLKENQFQTSFMDAQAAVIEGGNMVL